MAKILDLKDTSERNTKVCGLVHSSALPGAAKAPRPRILKTGFWPTITDLGAFMDYRPYRPWFKLNMSTIWPCSLCCPFSQESWLSKMVTWFSGPWKWKIGSWSRNWWKVEGEVGSDSCCAPITPMRASFHDQAWSPDPNANQLSQCLKAGPISKACSNLLCGFGWNANLCCNTTEFVSTFALLWKERFTKTQESVLL